jgi:hypothetical protein
MGYYICATWMTQENPSYHDIFKVMIDMVHMQLYAGKWLNNNL